MSKNDGGAAYPRRLPDGPIDLDRVLDVIEDYKGMTLRDYFAGQAISRCIAEVIREPRPAQESNLSTTEWTASMAYEFADAMIAERDK